MMDLVAQAILILILILMIQVPYSDKIRQFDFSISVVDILSKHSMFTCKLTSV